MHPFAAEKAFAQARNFSVDELREAIARLADLDLAVKGGSRLPAELELQRTLVAITRAPEAGVTEERQPRAGRPTMPEGYGVPDTDEGVLDWSWAVDAARVGAELLVLHHAPRRPAARDARLGGLARRRALLRGQPA